MSDSIIDGWESVIGLEIHAQLATSSKIFSGASTAYGAAPNTQACAVDLGLPGVLPVLNREAVRMAIRFGVAIDAQIDHQSVFARKNYFYPDLPKGYQISQLDHPIVGKGSIAISPAEGEQKIVGITRGTNRGHIARAALEGIAFQVADVLDAMKQDAGAPIEELRVDGGACVNDLLMQFQSDIMQVPVIRPKVIETTALGAAFLAGLAVGFWSDVAEIQKVWQTDKVFQPSMSADEVATRRSRWTEALSRSKQWEQHA